MASFETKMTRTFGQASLATSANSWAVLTTACFWRILLHTARFTVPPIPSTGPFPCAVAKKLQSTYFRLLWIKWGRVRFDNENLFLNWLPAPSVTMCNVSTEDSADSRIVRLKATTANLLCSRSSLTTANELGPTLVFSTERSYSGRTSNQKMIRFPRIHTLFRKVHYDWTLYLQAVNG